MACLFGAEPLSKPTMATHPSHNKEQTSMKKYQNQSIFIDEIRL